VHFWGGSADNIVEKNAIVNCDRGIGFGMDGRGNSGGVIRNNVIYHAAGNGSFADAAIVLNESPGSLVYNNTVFMENDFPWGIEYRFSSTQNVLIVNNLSNKPIVARDGASGSLGDNVLNATSGWFVDAGRGNLHLASTVGSVVDTGRTVSGLLDDFDGDRRPQGSAIDIGADEFLLAIVPKPPTNVRVLD
jgi:hypothetical protein